MSTVTKIGKAALQRLIRSKVMEIRRDKPLFTIEKSELNLALASQHGKPPYLGNDVYGDVINYGIWGIELGFKELALDAGESVMLGIQRTLGDRSFGSPDVPVPSHIVLAFESVGKGGEYNGGFFDANRFHIFRLSQNQEAEMKKMRIAG